MRKAVWVEGQLSDWTDSMLSKDDDGRIDMMGDGAAGRPLNRNGEAPRLSCGDGRASETAQMPRAIANEGQKLQLTMSAIVEGWRPPELRCHLSPVASMDSLGPIEMGEGVGCRQRGGGRCASVANVE